MSGSDVNMETLFRIASRRQTVCGGGGVYGGDRRRPVSVYIVSAIPRTEVSSDPATTLPCTVSGGDNVTPHRTIMGTFLLLLFLLSHSSKVRGWWQIYSMKYIKLAAALLNELVVWHSLKAKFKVMVKECLLLMRDDASKQSQVNILESYSVVSPCSAQFSSNSLESKSGYCCASEKVFITLLLLILSTHISTLHNASLDIYITSSQN